MIVIDVDRRSSGPGEIAIVVRRCGWFRRSEGLTKQCMCERFVRVREGRKSIEVKIRTETNFSRYFHFNWLPPLSHTHEPLTHALLCQAFIAPEPPTPEPPTPTHHDRNLAGHRNYANRRRSRSRSSKSARLRSRSRRSRSRRSRSRS